MKKMRLFFLTLAIFLKALNVPLANLQAALPSDDFPLHEENRSSTDYATKTANPRFPFMLVDPELAPEQTDEKVMLGYQILLNTGQYAKKYVNDSGLNCRSCHFSAGNTFGGMNGGISLVGVNFIFPRYPSNGNRPISLADRLNYCFIRSMNGKPVPEDSIEMKAIIAYLNWISSPAKGLAPYPWLGLKRLDSSHQPDSESGEKIYLARCASCHQINGEGSTNIPPLWGTRSFNDGAGMARLPTLASFVFLNMPYQEPILSAEEAIDVAAYILKQKRPRYILPPQGYSFMH